LKLRSNQQISIHIDIQATHTQTYLYIIRKRQFCTPQVVTEISAGQIQQRYVHVNNDTPDHAG